MCQARVVIRSNQLHEMLADALESQGAQIYRDRESIEDWENQEFVMLSNIGPGFTINVLRHLPGGSAHGTHALSVGWPLEETGGINRCIEAIMFAAEER